MSETTIARSRLLRGPLRPLRVRQYRLLVGSVTLAVLAAGVWLVALVWQVIRLGGGAPQLSVVATASAVGIIATSLFGGVLADRIPGRHILLAVTGVRTATIAVVAVLALTESLRLWQLVTVALVIGVGNGFTYPAYSALLPAVLSERDLMAANGLEQTMRPTVMQAAGPALASAVIAASSPAAALAVVAAVELAGVACLVAMRHVPMRRSLDGEQRHGARAVVRDLRDGFTYMARTPWLLATLLFASLLVLLVIGPIEVLLPFVVKDRAGGGPGDHTLVLGAFGVGGALGSLVMGSLKMPRRYLTVMVGMWGVACVPLAAVGLARDVWLVVVAVFVVGVFFNAPIVIWGTLLQRRVPPELLGRVSSLDFFVSLAFMPVSMAVAGPVSMVIGLGATFVLAGLVPPILAVAAILLARLPHDERTHPLATTPEVAPAPETELAPQVDLAAHPLPPAPELDLTPHPRHTAPDPDPTPQPDTTAELDTTPGPDTTTKLDTAPETDRTPHPLDTTTRLDTAAELGTAPETGRTSHPLDTTTRLDTAAELGTAPVADRTPHPLDTAPEGGTARELGTAPEVGSVAEPTVLPVRERGAPGLADNCPDLAA